MTEARWHTGENSPLFEKVQELRRKVEELRDLTIKDAEKKLAGLTELVKVRARQTGKADG